MKRLTILSAAVLAVIAVSAVAQPVFPVPAPNATPAPAAAVPDPNALKWDGESKEYNAKEGEASVPFAFTATNTSKADILINSLRTSCGCTVAQLPSTPYVLGPGSNVTINVALDVRGKYGAVTKTVGVDTSAGFKSLLVRANVPQPAQPADAPAAAGGNSMGNRAKNIQTALGDRQAIFKGDCVSCHVEPGKGKFGAELYVASCGICHEAEHRAAMVPDLKVAKAERDTNYWHKWISEGRPGSLMPGFAAAHGGPLTPEQINSLVTYLYASYPRSPKASAAAPGPNHSHAKVPAPRAVAPVAAPAPVAVPPKN